MPLKFNQRIKNWFVVSVVLLSLLSAGSVIAADSKIDLNMASVKQLQTLKGIGETLAKRIVDFRDKNGPFMSIDEVKKTKGIGTKIFKNIEGEITVSTSKKKVTP